MAIVNFSVPDDIKAEFDATFAAENKSAVVARLMRAAVEERRRQERRRRAVQALLRIQTQTTPRSAAAVRRARRVGRP